MRTHTLLLVDDSITVQRVVQSTFADEPFRVVVVEDGRLALDRIEADRPDIVLASTGARGLDGYAIAHAVSKKRQLRKIPVLLLTDRLEARDDARATASGAKGTVPKPIEPSVILVRVKQALGISASDGDTAADRPGPVKVRSSARRPRASRKSGATTSDPPGAEPPTHTAEQRHELETAFDSIDAVMSETSRPPEPITPEALARIVSAAVAQAIADYERARGLAPDPALDSTIGGAVRHATRDLVPRLEPDAPVAAPTTWQTELERLQHDLGINEIEFDEPPRRPAESVVPIGLAAEMGIDDFAFDAFDDPAPPSHSSIATLEVKPANERAPSSEPSLANRHGLAATEPTTDDAPTPLDMGLDWLATELSSNYARRERAAMGDTRAPGSTTAVEFDEDDLPRPAAAVGPLTTQTRTPPAPAVFWAAPVKPTQDDSLTARPVAAAESVTVATHAREGMIRGATWVRSAWDRRLRIGMSWADVGAWLRRVAMRVLEPARRIEASVRADAARVIGRCRAALADRADRRAQSRAVAAYVPEPPAPAPSAPPPPEPPHEREPAASPKTHQPQAEADTIFFTFDPIPPVPPRLPREPRQD